jgi:hypothetical protein
MFKSSVSGVVIGPWAAIFAVVEAIGKIGEIQGGLRRYWIVEEQLLADISMLMAVELRFVNMVVSLTGCLPRLKSVGKCRGSSTCTGCWAGISGARLTVLDLSLVVKYIHVKEWMVLNGTF